jgi:tRNA_anti-like
VESKRGRIRRVKYWKTTLTLLVALSASVALADDFKTVDGKEYKNVKVSRVEPDGIVLITKSGISKVYFAELPKEVQERYNYDAQKATEFTSETTEKIGQALRQRAEAAQQKARERAQYWSENPTPRPVQEAHGSSLDRPAYNRATTAAVLFDRYATNQINADRQYKGQTFTISGTIKSITSSGGETAVDLVKPYYAPEVHWIRCVFSNPRGLEQYQAGNTISLTGTVDGVDGGTLTIKDCQLSR